MLEIRIVQVEIADGPEGRGLYIRAKVDSPRAQETEKRAEAQKMYNRLCCGKAELSQNEGGL